MKRTKRITIRRIALGLAVVAMAAPPAAQAGPDEGLNGLQAEPAHTILVGADDRPRPRVFPTSQPSLVTSDDSSGIGVLELSGLALLLGAGTALMVGLQSRRSRLASA